MKFSLKQIAFIVCAVGLTYIILTYLHNKELSRKNTELRLEREAHSEVVETYNEQIGSYTTRIGSLTSNIQKEKRLNDTQRTIIKELEKDLDVKIDEVNTITIAYEAISDTGHATIVIAENDTVNYSINDYKNGVRLAMELKHPTGAYTYNLTHDLLLLEIYGARENDSGIRIGSIKFPNADYIKVGSWELFYDEDTRNFFQRLWDNIHVDLGVFGGPSTGMSFHLGYKKILVGPVFTEEGMNVGVQYRLK